MSLPPNPSKVDRQVLLAASSQEVRFALGEAVAKVPGWAVAAELQTGVEAVREIARTQPEVAILAAELEGIGGVACAQEIRAQGLRTQVILLANEASPAVARDALAAGAKSLLLAPVDDDEVRAALGQVGRVEPRFRPSQPPRNPERAPVAVRGHGIWCFASPNAGAGRTSLAISLATLLAQMGRSVALVDLDLLFGDLDFYLALDPGPPSIATLLNSGDLYEESRIRSHLRSHPAGFQVLVPPAARSRSIEMDPRLVSTAVRAMEPLFDHVLVDLPPGLPDYLELFDEARFLICVGQTELVRLKNLAVLVELLRRCGYSGTKLACVVRGPVSPAYSEALEELKLPVLAQISEAPLVLSRAVDRALPAPVMAPESGYASEVRKLLDDLLHRHRAPPIAYDASAQLGERLLG